MEMEPIGYLESCFGGKFGVPRQPGLCPSAWGVLELRGKYRSLEAVRGLEGFSHVWLIFGFHQTVEEGWKPTVRPPRLGGNERVGVFASRSTYRPNGLGLSLVKLDRIAMEGEGGKEPPVLYFSGVDLVDGTPVYDMKPYLPFVESLPEAIGGYAGEVPGRVVVKIEEGAEGAFAELDPRSQRVICEVLSLDPRPAAGGGEAGRTYGAELCGRNVRFRFIGVTCCISAVSG